MFFKILQIIQFNCSLIHEAEQLYPAGAGAEKKAAVMKSLMAELRKEGMVGSEDGAATAAVVTSFGELVDATVATSNAVGAFPHRAPAESSSAADTPPPTPEE